MKKYEKTSHISQCPECILYCLHCLVIEFANVITELSVYGRSLNLVPRALFPGFGKPGKSALGTTLGEAEEKLKEVQISSSN